MSTLLQTRTKFLDAARSQEGFKAVPIKQTPFRETAGDWDGAFIGWAARTAGFYIPDLLSTTAALAWYVSHNRLYHNPRIGDIAFYAFAYDGGPGAPHVGIVSDVDHWRDGWFRDIEGQAASGRPRESTEPIGVFERVRFRHDVLGFARPGFAAPPGNVKVSGTVLVGPSIFLPGSTGNFTAAINIIQDALTLTVGFRARRRGVWDTMARSAYAAWQRQIGAPATGTPTYPDLAALSARTGLFEARP